MTDHRYHLTFFPSDDALPGWEFEFVDPGEEIFSIGFWQDRINRWVVSAYWDYWDYCAFAIDNQPERITEHLNKTYKSLDEALESSNQFMRRWGRFTRPLLTKDVLAWAQLCPGERLCDFDLENQPKMTSAKLDDLGEAA